MEKENPSLIVLMADDDEDDCLLVESAFKETDLVHELRFVGDGRELLDYLYNEGDFSDLEKYPRPNLILLDLNMPRIDGREALAIIKSDPRLQNIPILILTTSREERDIALAEGAGA
ncbi:MAG: response regulator, partial [Syntrophobacteraceae bacterium]